MKTGRNGEIVDRHPEEDESIPDIVTVTVEDSIDLHTFRPGEVADLLDDYLREAAAKGFREVRIIHGKGIGVQRERVRSLLAKHPLVREFRQAEESGGGWGATIAILDCKGRKSS